MKSLCIYVHFNSREQVNCICLQSFKKCGKQCYKEILYYDEFDGIRECFKNKGSKVGY